MERIGKSLWNGGKYIFQRSCNILGFVTREEFEEFKKEIGRLEKETKELKKETARLIKKSDITDKEIKALQISDEVFFRNIEKYKIERFLSELDWNNKSSLEKLLEDITTRKNAGDQEYTFKTIKKNENEEIVTEETYKINDVLMIVENAIEDTKKFNELGQGKIESIDSKNQEDKENIRRLREEADEIRKELDGVLVGGGKGGVGRTEKN